MARRLTTLIGVAIALGIVVGLAGNRWPAVA